MPCRDDVEQTTDMTRAAPDLPPGVPPLSTLYLYVTGACNLACRHCWISPGYEPNGGGEFVRVEHVAKAVHEGKSLGLSAVKLTGGEPLLHPRFRDLVALLASEGLDITIETNGTLVDEELAGFLRDTGRVSFISVSLDGATAGVHEALRVVPGSFQRAVNGIQALVRAGYRPQMICTLHRGNSAQMTEVIALAERLGCGSVKFNHLQGAGRGAQFAAHEGLGVAHVLELHRTLERELLRQSGIAVYFDIPVAFHSIRRLAHDPLGTCDISSILGMLAGGELALCGIGTTVPELVYGHIAEDDLRAVWCGSPGLDQLRALIPARLEGICAVCLHRDTCLGACVADNYHQTGRLNSAYRFCAEAERLGLFPESRRRDTMMRRE